MYIMGMGAIMLIYENGSHPAFNLAVDALKYIGSIALVLTAVYLFWLGAQAILRRILRR